MVVLEVLGSLEQTAYVDQTSPDGGVDRTQLRYQLETDKVLSTAVRGPSTSDTFSIQHEVIYEGWQQYHEDYNISFYSNTYVELLRSATNHR